MNGKAEGVNAERLALFGAVYVVELERAAESDPDYAYLRGEAAEVKATVGRMLPAVARGGYNLSGAPLRRTCKAFGIPHTYKAVAAWLAEGVEAEAEGAEA